MMISNLPVDLLEEILSRVPLKSMRALRLTSKKWNALSKSQSFLKMHIAKEEEAARELQESRMIVMKNLNVYLTSIVVAVNENPSTRPHGKLILLKDSEQVDISQVFHCDGLLLCILEDDTRLVVSNPYLGQTRWIETRYTYHHKLPEMFYGYTIGYENNSCRTYKILRFIDCKIGITDDKYFWYEIYDFDSGLWKTLDNVTRDWLIVDCNRGVSVKGNTYWWAEENNSVVDRIICFDFTREEFVPFLRLPLDMIDQSNVNLSSVGDEKLAVFLQDDVYTNGIEVWITTKIDAKNVSWIKFLTVDKGLHPDFRLTCWSFFVDEEKKVAMIFLKIKVYIIGEAGYFRKLDLRILPHYTVWPSVCSYVPSLVEIKQREGGEREKQSDLEKRLYDQYMSRLVALEEEEAKWIKRQQL